MPIDVSQTLLGLDALGLAINEATESIVDSALASYNESIRRHAPVGTPGNTTNAPGDLIRSVFTTGPFGGDGVYAGKVGPTTIYGRQRELGGHIYGNPILHFTRFGSEVFTGHVYQVPTFYTQRAYQEVTPRLYDMATERIAEVLSTT